MKKLLIILPLIILFSCSVQKRKYQKGFYVSSNKTKTIAKKDRIASAKKENRSEVLAIKCVPLVTDINNELEASADKKISALAVNKPLINLSKDEPCDKITFKNGDEISVKILEIAPFDIKYKKCDSPDGPSYIIKKSTVFMITYANGTKEVFKAEPEVKQSNNNNNNNNSGNSNSNKGPSIPESAVISLIAGICGFAIFIGSIPAICFGIAAIRKINREPEKYAGKGMATIGIILGILGVIGKILLFALIFSL